MPNNSRSSRASLRASLRALGASILALAALACSDSSGPNSAPLVDARIVAFSSTTGNINGLSIFLMHADGSAKTRLTSEGFLDESPVWSPDGSAIAFDSNRDTAGIWLVDADGTNLRQFITSPEFDRPSGIAWAPDGSKIAFTAHVNTVFAILVANANGSNAHRLTTNPLGEQRPSWSPDGTRIAFEAQTNDTSETRLFVIGADGTGQLQLTSGTFDGGARWSPDGSQLVFDRHTNPGIQVFVMNADGSNQHALTTSGANFGAAWSPDGQQFEHTVIRNNQNQISRMNADGSDVRLITTTGTNAFPAWKPTP
jgi:TolB protein